MSESDPTDEGMIAALNAVLAAPDAAAVDLCLSEHAAMLLTSRAEYLLEVHVLRIQEEAQEAIHKARAIADRIRQSREGKTFDLGFHLYDGRLISDPNELYALILSSRTSQDTAAEHFLIDGVSWLLSNPLFTLPEEVRAMCGALRGTALLNRADRQTGSAAQNDIEASLSDFSSVLAIWTQELDKERYAMVKSNYGAALAARAQRLSGATAFKDLGQALAAYDTALEIRTPISDPRGYATVQLNRGNALRDRAERQSGSNALRDIENSLLAYGAALTIWTSDSDPQLYAQIQMNRGNAIRTRANLRAGAAALADLEEAQSIYSFALDFLLPESFPQDFALVQMNLGTAYAMRAALESGAAALESFGKSISAYDASLEIWTRGISGSDHAAVQMNRSNAFANRARLRDVTGALDDLDIALRGFDAALAFFPSNTDAHRHALLQMNRGNALKARATLMDRTGALERIEEALSAYDASLAIWEPQTSPPDYAAVHMNRGNALLTAARWLSGAEAADVFKAAIAAYDKSLAILTPDADPEGYAKAQFNRSGASLDYASHPWSPLSRRSEAYAEARDAASAALSIWTPTFDPPNWLLAQRRLASACHGLGDVAGARSALEAALEEGRRGILGSGDALARTLVAQRIAGAGDALALLRLRVDGDAAGALAALGLGRGVQMGADLVMARLEADPDLALQRDALRLLQAAREDLALADRELARLRGMAEGARRKIGAAVEAGNDEAAAEARDVLKLADDQLPTLEAERAAASAAFDTARAAHEAGLAEAGLTLDPVPPGWEAVAVALPEGGALAVPIVGEDAEGGALLILGRGPDGSPQAAWTEMPGLNEKATRSLLSGTMADAEDGATGHDTAGWLSAYSDLRRALTAAEGKARPHGPALLALDVAVRAMGRQLWDLLMGLLDRALRTFGLMPGAEVVLMPPGRLAALPLAAAHPAPETGDAPIRPFVTDWALSIVPSPQALVAAQARIDRLARLDAPVANAGDDAPGHRLLCVATPAEFAPNPVADLVSPEMRQEIEGADATPEAVRNALPGYRFAAFLCHGHWEPQDPGRSGLQLAGPPDEAGRETHAMLTLGDLQRPGVAAGDARSWLLMACETAPVGLDAPDEFAGLAVRLAGEVPAVTGTLYPVLLCHAEKMGRAVLALQIGPQRLSPAQALRQAQLTALHSGRAGLEALVAEAIAPQPATPDRAPPPPRRPAPGPSPALGLPNRTLFTGEHDDQTSDPEDSPSPENHDPDNRDTYLLAHWAAFATYGR